MALAPLSEPAKRLFFYENPAFDHPLGRVVVDADFQIFQKPSDCSPVFQGVVSSFHELMRRSEPRLGSQYGSSQSSNQRFRFHSPDSETLWRRLVLNLSLYFVKLAVCVENGNAKVRIAEFRFEVFAPGAGVAAGFDFAAASEERIESASGISLEHAFKFLE